MPRCGAIYQIFLFNLKDSNNTLGQHHPRQLLLLNPCQANFMQDCLVHGCHVCQTGTAFDSGTHSTELEAQLHKQYNYILLQKFCQSELSSTHQCTHYPKDEWSVDIQATLFRYIPIPQLTTAVSNILNHPHVSIYLPIEALPTYVPTKYTKTPQPPNALPTFTYLHNTCFHSLPTYQ